MQWVTFAHRNWIQASGLATVFLPKSCPLILPELSCLLKSGRMQWIPGASCSYALLPKWEKRSLIGNAEIKNVFRFKTPTINNAYETTWQLNAGVFPGFAFPLTSKEPLSTSLLLMSSLSYSIYHWNPFAIVVIQDNWLLRCYKNVYKVWISNGEVNCVFH